MNPEYNVSLMSTTVRDHVMGIGKPCGASNDILIVLKIDKKDQALEKILKKATLKSKVTDMVYDLSYNEHSFSVYASGRIIFRDIENTQTLNRILDDLLL